MNESKKKATRKGSSTGVIIPIDEVPAIYPAMSAVMSDIEAIGKDSENKLQKWKFRGIDAAYNAIHPLLAKHDIFTVPRALEGMRREERATRSGGISIYTIIKMEYDFVSGIDGSKITIGPIRGEAMDSGDKSCNKCMAVAHKYAIFQTFCIPTESSDDPDKDIHDIVGPPIPESVPLTTGPTMNPPPLRPGAGLPPLQEPAQVTQAVQQQIPPPVTATPPVQPVAVPAAVAPPPVDGGETLVINSAEDAAQVADWVIGLIQSLDTKSVDGLAHFWNQNKRVIDKLDQEYHYEYERIRTVFTQLRIDIQAGATS